MNEKRIREVIEVEQRALELLAQGNREADQIPIQAEAQAAAILEDARAAAHAEARRMIEEAQARDDSAGIISRAQDEMSHVGALADKNLEKAVAYVLDRVLGRS